MCERIGAMPGEKNMRLGSNGLQTVYKILPDLQIPRTFPFSKPGSGDGPEIGSETRRDLILRKLRLRPIPYSFQFAVGLDTAQCFCSINLLSQQITYPFIDSEIVIEPAVCSQFYQYLLTFITLHC